MINNTDYIRIHDLIQSEEYKQAAEELLKQSRSAVADFIRSYTKDEGYSKMRHVILHMNRLEKK